MSRNHNLSILLAFVAGIVVAIFGARLVGSLANRLLFPERHTEVARVSSPDGTLDAVTERVNCGAPCSATYTVSVVPKGSVAEKNPTLQIFLADDVVNPQVRWREPNLVDIAYDKAFIHSFRNVVYPFGQPGNIESWRYAVEIHLAPSSSRFSYLGDAASR